MGVYEAFLEEGEGKMGTCEELLEELKRKWVHVKNL